MPFRLLARMIPNAMRQATMTTAAMTMPAMAPEDKPEDDLEAWGMLEGLDSGEDESEVLGLPDGLDSGEDEEVVASALDQQCAFDSGRLGLPLDATVDDEVLEMLLRVATTRLLEDVDEDSTALASAIETFAFALAKLVLQTLI